jgi:8-oxo-dGTP pyrophosphatase MutT (NUDIX family)
MSENVPHPPSPSAPPPSSCCATQPEFEVLMVKRHHQIDFASGALVFPGGKTHAGDTTRPGPITASAGTPSTTTADPCASR